MAFYDYQRPDHSAFHAGEVFPYHLLEGQSFEHAHPHHQTHDHADGHAFHHHHHHPSHHHHHTGGGYHHPPQHALPPSSSSQQPQPQPQPPFRAPHLDHDQPSFLQDSDLQHMGLLGNGSDVGSHTASSSASSSSLAGSLSPLSTSVCSSSASPSPPQGYFPHSLASQQGHPHVSGPGMDALSAAVVGHSDSCCPPVSMTFPPSSYHSHLSAVAPMHSQFDHVFAELHDAWHSAHDTGASGYSSDASSNGSPGGHFDHHLSSSPVQPLQHRTLGDGVAPVVGVAPVTVSQAAGVPPSPQSSEESSPVPAAAAVVASAAAPPVSTASPSSSPAPALARRGRPPAATLSKAALLVAADTAGSRGSSPAVASQAPLSEEEQYQRRREANNLSARKSRLRRKQRELNTKAESEKLQEVNSQYLDTIRDLERKVALQAEQLSFYKAQLARFQDYIPLQHSDV